MKIKIEEVDINAEVILFNDELGLVKILSGGEIQKEYDGKKVIPSYSKGRLIDFQFKFKDGNHYKSYVVGLNKRIASVGYVVDDTNAEQAVRDLEEGNLDIVLDGEPSDTIVLFFK